MLINIYNGKRKKFQFEYTTSQHFPAVLHQKDRQQGLLESPYRESAEATPSVKS